MSYFRILTTKIIKETGIDNFSEACKKYEYLGLDSNFDTNCICTHPIKEVYKIRNKETNIVHIIGSECRKYFSKNNREFKEEIEREKIKQEKIMCRGRKKMKVGKYKGYTYSYIYSNCSNYITWLKSQSLNGEMVGFIEYCELRKLKD